MEKEFIILKKNFNDKQKKTYHELAEEQDLNKEVFKRSEQPRKKPVILKEETETPKYNSRNGNDNKKPYQKKEFDRDERSSKVSSRNTTDFKKPYQSRENNNSDQKKSYVPKSGPANYKK